MELKLKLKISPNASKSEIVKTDTDIKIKLTAQPIDGKANKCLVEFLSKSFKIPKSNIEILKGETGREKTLLFKNLEQEKYNLLINNLTFQKL